MNYGHIKNENYDIMRLRGYLPGISTLIPMDIKLSLGKEKIEKLENISQEIIEYLDIRAKQNAKKRIVKTKSLTKQARKDILTITGHWGMTEEDYEKNYVSIRH